MIQGNISLTSQFTNHKNLNKAGAEALKNAQLLALAGFIEPAYRITSQLLGLADNKLSAWQVNPNTGFVYEVHHVHQLLCWLLGKPVPEIATEAVITVAELNEDAEERWDDLLGDLVFGHRMQSWTVGKDWSEGYFAQLAKMESENGVYKDFGLFEDALDWLSIYHLRQMLVAHDPSMSSEFEYDTISISDKASNYDLHWLVDTFTELQQQFNQKTNSQGLDYMEERIYQRILLIDITNKNVDSARIQFKRLLSAEDLYDVLKLFYCPWFKPLAEQGSFAACIGIDTAQVEDYLQLFSSRTDTSDTSKKSQQATQAEAVHYATLDELKAILKSADNPWGKELLGMPLQEIAIPESYDTLLAIRIPQKKHAKNEAEWRGMWQFAHTIMPQTNRYPVLIMDWGLIDGDNWQDFLDRELYANEDFAGDRLGVSHHQLIQGANNLSAEEVSTFIAEPANCYYEFELAKQAFIRQLAGDDKPEPSFEDLTWFLPNNHDEVYLLFLPTQQAWTVPAFVQFYGAESYGSEVLMAQLKAWQEKYGVHIEWALGTMINISVEKRPGNEIEALELAFIQHLLAPCTYAQSGISMEEYAMTLMESDKWFLHERP